VNANSPDTRGGLKNSDVQLPRIGPSLYFSNNKNNGPRRRYIQIKLLRRIKILLLLLLPRRVQRGACLMAFQ